MFIICVWVDKKANESKFENSIPLLFLGSWLQDNNCQEEFHIVFCYGKNHLSKDYVRELERIPNYRVFDYESDFQSLLVKYASLGRFGSYECNCFLRWFVIQKHIEIHKISQQIVHIDGDVLFNATPAEILEDTKNFTFTLEGSPAFVSITDYRWLSDYTREIDAFSSDIQGYSESAWKERDGWQITQKTKWAGNRFRETITSDQDLVSHLIHTSRIIQDDIKAFCAQSKLFYTVNPLYIYSHAPMQLHKANGLKFTVTDSCFLEDRKIAIWHFQSNFIRYLNHFLFLRNIHYPFRVPNELETNRIVRMGLNRTNDYFSSSRLQIYRMVKELNRNREGTDVSLADIFNRRKFWKKDIFK